METSEFLDYFIGKLHDDVADALEGLNDEQLYFLLNDNSCHAAFHAWHVVRTADNVINFVCQDRKPPVWMRQELPQKWNLPKAAQGTGMELAEARALRVQYTRDVKDDICPYLRDASDADLDAITKVAQFGEKPKLWQIGQTIVTHGNTHLGQLKMLRSAQGLSGDAM